MSQFGSIGTSATPAPSSRTPPLFANTGSPGTAEGVLQRNLDSPRWVPDAMAPSCCGCHMKFNMIRRRHHCRTCCRVFCNGCSSNSMDNKRTCVACWDRVGRKASGIGLAMSRGEVATASANADEAAAEGREHKPALLELLEVDRTIGAGRHVDGDAAMSTPRPQQLASSPPPEERLPISGQPSRYSRHEAASATGRGSESGVDPPPDRSQAIVGSGVMSLPIRLATIPRAIFNMFFGNNDGVIASPLGGNGVSSRTAVAHGREGSVVSVSIAISIGSVGGASRAVEALPRLSGGFSEAAATSNDVDGSLGEFRRGFERTLSVHGILRIPGNISFCSPFSSAVATMSTASLPGTSASNRVVTGDREEPAPPVGRGEGKPAVEEWSPGKKMLCRFTAACLAMFIIIS